MAAAGLAAVALAGNQASEDAMSNLSNSKTSRSNVSALYALPPTATSTELVTTSCSTTSCSTTSVPVATPSRTAPVPTTTAGPSVAGLDGRLVVIDPGHQGRGDSSLEPIGPGSSQMKPKVTGGTVGVVTGLAESRLVLSVAFLVKEELEERGVRVLMTRTSQDVNISNSERAQMANRAGADLFIRIHADSAENNSSRKGISVLYPAVTHGWTDDIAASSKRAAGLTLEELIEATAANNLGLHARADMSGFNWADVPAIIPEIGFMSNPEEDRLLSTTAYQKKIAEALARAAVRFLSGG